MIRDSVIKIEDLFYVAGREDRSINNFSDYKRKSLKEVLSPVKEDLPVILMDHQPFELKLAAEAGVDLQLSGHTHHGQLFPLNYITAMIYEVSWGYKLINNTHFYVSSGAGGWGPPVRTGSVPEVIILKIAFN